MITCFLQLNLKLLLVLILFGFIMGQTRHAALQNFAGKKCGFFIMDFFNLIGTPIHELGHLLLDIMLTTSAFTAQPKRQCVLEVHLVSLRCITKTVLFFRSFREISDSFLSELAPSYLVRQLYMLSAVFFLTVFRHYRLLSKKEEQFSSKPCNNYKLLI